MSVFRSVSQSVKWNVQQFRRQTKFNHVARRIARDHHMGPYGTFPVQKGAFAAIVCMIRGEDDYLIEWIEFHRLMGVDHFFIYDNAVNDASAATTHQLLSRYIDEQLLTCIRWPDVPSLRTYWETLQDLSIQQLAYGDCIQRFRKNVRWLIKIDVDEFMFPIQAQHASVSEVLQSLGDDKISGVMIRRSEFGSHGHVRRPPGLVVENYLLRAANLGDDTKIASNTNFLSHDHFAMAFESNYALPHRIRGKIFGAPRQLSGPEAESLLQINHYDVKSREEYDRKFQLNTAGYLAGKETGARFEMLDRRYSEKEDRKILRFVPDLRERMQRLTIGSTQ